MYGFHAGSKIEVRVFAAQSKWRNHSPLPHFIHTDSWKASTWSHTCLPVWSASAPKRRECTFYRWHMICTGKTSTTSHRKNITSATFYGRRLSKKHHFTSPSWLKVRLTHIWPGHLRIACSMASILWGGSRRPRPSCPGPPRWFLWGQQPNLGPTCVWGRNGMIHAFWGEPLFWHETSMNMPNWATCCGSVSQTGAHEIEQSRKALLQGPTYRSPTMLRFDRLSSTNFGAALVLSCI